MKLFLEADFTKGSGAFRWEGVTARRLRRIMLSCFALVGLLSLLVARYSN